MKALRGLCAAFSMYSSVPVPRVEWDEDSLRYALAFFPLVGAVIGGLCALWAWFCATFSIGTSLWAAGTLVISLLISGGIHLDGFCDTADALASHQSRERKLEILKDSHVGAFAVIGLGFYLLVACCAWCELIPSSRAALCVLPGFALARALSALAAVTLPSARGGLLSTFTVPANRRAVIAASVGFALICAALMIHLDFIAGGTALVAAVLCFGWYRVLARRIFGGVTGDLAGFFVCICELSIVLAAALAQHLIRGGA